MRRGHDRSLAAVGIAALNPFEVGGDRWRAAYAEAVDRQYRFLSFGDACLFERAAS